MGLGPPSASPETVTGVGVEAMANADDQQDKSETPVETPSEPAKPSLPDPGKEMKLTEPHRDDVIDL
jgi:hypothetical protein